MDDATSKKTMGGNSPEFLTVGEAATLLRISKSLVYSLIESGKLTASRLGKGSGAIRILREDLYRYVNESRIQPGGKAPPRTRRTEKLRHIKL